MKLKVINIDGKKVNDIDVSDKIFSLKPNDNMIQSLINWQLNHFKPRTAKTKQRNEIKGSTAKIYAQKGTGGARHSSRKAPIFVGGGVAHGPAPKEWSLKLSKKMRRFALFNALSARAQEDSVYIIEGINKLEAKTKLFVDFFKKNIKYSPEKDSVLLIISEKNESIQRGTRNIKNIQLVVVNLLNAYDILRFKKIVFTKEALDKLEELTKQKK